MAVLRATDLASVFTGYFYGREMKEILRATLHYVASASGDKLQQSESDAPTSKSSRLNKNSNPCTVTTLDVDSVWILVINLLFVLVDSLACHSDMISHVLRRFVISL